MVLGWVCGFAVRIKGVAFWFWVRARRLGQGDFARGSCAGRMAKNVAGAGCF